MSYLMYDCLEGSSTDRGQSVQFSDGHNSDVLSDPMLRGTGASSENMTDDRKYQAY